MQVAPDTTSQQGPAVLRRRRRIAAPEPASPVALPTPVLIEMRRSCRRTGVAFRALLGVAACLSLVAVVQRATETEASSPDRPPPPVFVQTD